MSTDTKEISVVVAGEGYAKVSRNEEDIESGKLERSIGGDVELTEVDSKPQQKKVMFSQEVGDKDFDLEVGEGGNENVTIFDWAENLAAVDGGCWIKTVTGTAGNDPSQDSFPWFASNTEVYIRLLWDLLPSDWRLVIFPNGIPKNAYDPDEYLQAKQIMIKDVSDVMLEKDPSKSLRIYLGETKQVVRLTPIPVNRAHAAAWVDAIYASMHLQAVEEGIEASGGSEGGLEMDDLLDLRDQFYEQFPDRKPLEFEEILDANQELAMTTYDPNVAAASATLGAEDDANDRRRSMRDSGKRPNSHRYSFTMDFGTIYDNQKKEKVSYDQTQQQDRECCIMS